MPPIDLMLDDPAAAMPMARDMLSLEEPQEEPEGDDPRALYEQLIANIQSNNIAEDLDETELNKIGQKVIREYEIDDNSRSEWVDKSRKAMDLAMQIAKEKTFPWPNASNVVYPAMTAAAVQFNARAYPAVVQGRSVVKGVVVGKDDGVPIPPEMVQRFMGGGGQGGLPMLPQPMGGMGGGPPMPGAMGPQGPQQQQWFVPPGAKAERAQRIGEHMSWQLLEQMKYWEEQTDKLLLILPIVGCAFRKSFFDNAVGHNASLLVLAQNLVINHHAESMEEAPRITEQIKLYPYEIEENIRAGLFIDQRYEKAQGEDDDAPVEFLEQHRRLDLDEDGYSEPYIVTVHKQSTKVARIVARYEAEGVHIGRDGRVVKIDPIHYYTKYDFIPNPDGGIYGVGFGQLLSPINEATNTALNQIFDAGSLQNTGGGFIGRGVSMHAGSLRFRLGEWKQLNVPGSAIKDAIVPFNHPGPSPVLFQLLGLLIEAGKEVASIKDVLTGETAAATMQPTTLMALIEQGTKVFNAIFKRVYHALKQELGKLYRLNRIYLPEQSQYQIGDEWRHITKKDYTRGSGVEPVADPNMVSNMQRSAQAQFLMGFLNDPNIKRVEIIKRVFDAVQVPKPEDLIIEEMPPNPAILAQTAELEAENRRIDIEEDKARATKLKDISQAILNIAKADEANASVPLEQTAQWIKVLEMQFNALLSPAEGRGQPPAQLPPLPLGPGLPEFEFAQPMMQ